MWGVSEVFSGEIEQMLGSSLVDIHCIRESRFRIQLFEMISGNTAECKLFSIGNEKSLRVVIFLAKKWIDKV